MVRVDDSSGSGNGIIRLSLVRVQRVPSATVPLHHERDRIGDVGAGTSNRVIDYVRACAVRRKRS